MSGGLPERPSGERLSEGESSGAAFRERLSEGGSTAPAFRERLSEGGLTAPAPRERLSEGGSTASAPRERLSEDGSTAPAPRERLSGDESSGAAFRERAPGERLRIAVFASGSGTNFQALIDAAQAGALHAEIALLVCDRPQAKAVERAKLAGIPAFVFRPRDYAAREQYEAEIWAELRRRQVDLIVLAGYMRLITDTLVEPFFGRMINIHPSLLPSFPGVDGIGQALRHGVRVTGVTVHYVDGGLDSGPIIAQQAVAVEPGETEESLAQKIHRAEHQLLPQVVEAIARGNVRLADGKVQFLQVL